jgi:hypothetical protein
MSQVFKAGAFHSVTGATAPEAVHLSSGGCPKYGVHHVSRIVTAKGPAYTYYCQGCRSPFNRE